MLDVSVPLGYLILVLGAILAFFLYVLNERKKQKRLKDRLDREWGKEQLVYRNYERIGIYNDNIKVKSDQFNLSSRSLEDLNFNEVYSRIDRCRTKIGQQYLFSILQRPLNNVQELEKRNTLSTFFLENEKVRQKLEAYLISLNKNLTYSIPNLIFTWELNSSKNRLLIWILSALPLVLIFLGIVVHKNFFLFLVISFVVNLFFHYKNKERVEFFIGPFAQIPSLRKYVLKVSKLDKIFFDEDVQRACDSLKDFGKYQFLLHSEKTGQNDLYSFLWLFMEYVKITFLVENNLLDICLKISNRSKDEIHTLFKYIGALDTAQSIASYRCSLEYFCIPKFHSKAPKIDTESAYHPLIYSCEPNDLQSNEKGIIITGSNMSGKTTFIRMISLNVVLAQTIYTVCAAKYEASFFNVYTSIGIQDDIMNGKSYYLEEINSIYSFINHSRKPNCFNLFVIDELFKGTNTVERIAGAKGVLEYLIKGDNLVIVSTHDTELADLLSPAYKLYHFEESVTSEGYQFDYRMKDGMLKTRNAIRLLEMFGYPDEVIESAFSYIISSET